MDNYCNTNAYSICEKGKIDLMLYLKISLKKNFNLKIVETSCASGWNRFLGNCYYKSISNQDFASSQQKCNSFSSSLVVINSTEEWNFIKNITFGSPNKFWVFLLNN